MSLRGDLGTMAGTLGYDLALSLGAAATFTNLNGSALTIYVFPLEGSTSQGVLLGIQTDETEKGFYIPRQTNFPPSTTDEARYGVVTDALLVYPASSGESYSMDRIEADSVGGGFRVFCTRRIAKRVGAE